MTSKQQKLQAFARLLDIMDELREKCPWDRKQTMESLRHLTIEEVYELGDAILENDLDEVKKELGDLMLHIVFYAKIGEEQGAFDVGTVAEEICEKLIARHPHIYGDVEVADEEDVKKNWENLKLRQGKDSVLQGVPKSLPAIVKAIRIQDKAAGVGFDWEKSEDVLDKVREELDEFQQELRAGNTEKTESEFGDLLFSLVNYARFLDINPEDALEKTNKKFITRFRHIEDRAKADNKPLQEMTLEEMDGFWEEAKVKASGFKPQPPR